MPNRPYWHGTILPVDDNWWMTHFPPNGWRCRCSVISVSVDDLDRFGWTVNAAAPPIEYRDWMNKRTGQIERVPVGIDPGWAYHVGKMPPASMLPPPTRKTPPVPPTT
ncbi:MAG: hypothetical protein ORN98_01125, partial [Alphaproteobacteria bacterium]|nr:hypothetical protein [Alphaproteobacteria bacterium]